MKTIKIRPELVDYISQKCDTDEERTLVNYLGQMDGIVACCWVCKHFCEEIKTDIKDLVESLEEKKIIKILGKQYKQYLVTFNPLIFVDADLHIGFTIYHAQQLLGNEGIYIEDVEIEISNEFEPSSYLIQLENGNKEIHHKFFKDLRNEYESYGKKKGFLK